MVTRNFYFSSLLSFFILFCVATAFGQPGNLDPTFNGTGIVFATNPTANEFAYASAIQPDGKLLVAGHGNIRFSDQYGFVIQRYNSTGQLDLTFGSSGRVYLDYANVREQVSSLAVQADGKILLGGTINDNVTNLRNGILIRFKTDGSVDSSFASDGRVITNFNQGAGGDQSVNQVRILQDGKILVSGFRVFDGLLAKYHIDGQPDLSFGTAGVQILYINQQGSPQRTGGFDVQPNGGIVVSGHNTVGGNRQFELSRYLPDGQLDLSLNNTGQIQTFIDNLGASATQVVVQNDGKIVMLGPVTRPHGFLNGNVAADFVVMRYTSNGLVDGTFGVNGKVFVHFYENDQPTGIAVQADGKILLSGTTYHFQDQGGRYVLARLLPTGILDSSFAINGKNIYTVNHTQEAWGAVMQIRQQRIYLSSFANGINNTGAAFNIYAIQNNVGPAESVTQDLCPGQASTALSAGITGQNYQWQQSVDSVTFVDIGNGPLHTGVTSGILSLNTIPAIWYGRQFRCVVDNIPGNVYSIRFLNTWTGAQSSAWEDPLNWSCATVPDASTAVVITSGTVIVSSNVTVRALTVNPGASLNVNPGFTLTITN